MRDVSIYSLNDLRRYVDAENFGLLLNTANEKYNRTIWRDYADWGIPSDGREWIQGQRDIPIMVRASILSAHGNKPQRNTTGWRTYGGSIPKLGHGFSIDESDLFALREASKLQNIPFGYLVTDSLIQNSRNMLGGIHNEISRMLLQAMSTGEISDASVDGTSYDFKFPIDAKNFNNVTEAWFTVGKDGVTLTPNEKADPIKDIIDAQKYITDVLQLNVDHWKMSKTLFDALLLHPAIQRRCVARVQYRNTTDTVLQSLLLTDEEKLAVIHGLGVWPFDVIDFKTTHEEDGVAVADPLPFDVHKMVAASSIQKPFTIKCANSIFKDRLSAGPTANSTLYSFVENRIGVLNTWQERPIENIIDFEVYAAPVFRDVHDIYFLTVAGDAKDDTATTGTDTQGGAEGTDTQGAGA